VQDLCSASSDSEEGIDIEDNGHLALTAPDTSTALAIDLTPPRPPPV